MGRRRDNQAGFTLIEELVALAMAGVVLAAVLGLSIVGLHQQSAEANDADTLAQLQTGTLRMSSELRAASAVSYATQSGAGAPVAPSALRIQLQIPGKAAPVIYDCAATPGTCARWSGGTETFVFASGIANGDVFTLECRSQAGQANEGDPVPMTPGGSTPAACGSAAASLVAIRFVAQVPCKGQGNATGACPAHQMTFATSVDLRNVATHA